MSSRTLRRLQRLDEASALLEACLEGNPGDSDARELDEEIRRRMNPTPDLIYNRLPKLRTDGNDYSKSFLMAGIRTSSTSGATFEAPGLSS